jgi:hypothetical protein
MPRSGRPIPPTPLVLPLIRKCEVLFPRCREVDIGFPRLLVYYHVPMSVLLALVTAGYFYDTFAYEICFYGDILLWDLHPKFIIIYCSV